MSSLTYSDGEVASYSYNQGGALASVSTTPSGGSATTLFGTLLYSTAAGTSGLLGSANVASDTYKYTPTYDGDLRLASQTWSAISSQTTLYSSSRTFDNVGNVASVSTLLPAGTDNQAFCYDEQDRLSWAAGSTATPPCGGTLTTGTLTSAAYGPTTFGYDTLDRLSSSPTGSYAYGDSAHLHAATSIGTYYSAAYDAAGNMTCRSTTSSSLCAGGANGEQLTYDNEGRLTAWQNAPSNPTSTESMAYDGEGNRVALAVTGNPTTYYLGSLEETTGSTVIKYFNAHTSGSALPTVERVGTGGALAYLASDGLGSVQAALDGSGNVTFQQLYTVWGRLRYTTGTSPTDKGYTGQKSDATSGLDYYNARYYDPMGRQFTSADTVRDGQNAYAYVLQNPCTNLDPTGECAAKRPTMSGWQRIAAVAVSIATWAGNILGLPSHIAGQGNLDAGGRGGTSLSGDDTPPADQLNPSLPKGTTSGGTGPCPDDDAGKGGTPYITVAVNPDGTVVYPDGTPVPAAGTVPSASPAPAPGTVSGPEASGQVARPDVDPGISRAEQWMDQVSEWVLFKWMSDQRGLQPSPGTSQSASNTCAGMPGWACDIIGGFETIVGGIAAATVGYMFGQAATTAPAGAGTSVAEAPAYGGEWPMEGDAGEGDALKLD